MHQSVDDIISALNMQPHPEGGFFVESFRDNDAVGLGLPGNLANRGAVSCIYFLLKAGQASDWHWVDGVEIWHHYAGAPLALHIATSDLDVPHQIRLGQDLAAGERPQGVVPSRAWQAAKCLSNAPDGYSLVGCTVSPGFHFDGFHLAPNGWSPGPHNESSNDSLEPGA